MARELLFVRDLAKDLPVRNLRLPQMKVEVTIEADEKLLQMAKRGEEGFHLALLADAASAYLDPIQNIVRAEVTRLDAKVPTLSADAAREMVETTNATLKNAARGTEQGVAAAVDQAWQEITNRKLALSSYRKKVAFKTTMSFVAAAVGTASLAVSGGTALFAYASVMKGVLELAYQMKVACMDAEQAALYLQEQIEKCHRIIAHDAQASRAEQLLNRSPLGRPLDEVVVAAVPLLAGKLGSFNHAAKAAEMYGAKLAGVDETCEKLWKQANAGLRQVQGLEKGDEAQRRLIGDLAMHNQHLIDRIVALQAGMRQNWAFHAAATGLIGEWTGGRYVVRTYGATKVTQAGLVAGLLGTARSIWQLLQAAGAPLPPLPV